MLPAMPRSSGDAAFRLPQLIAGVKASPVVQAKTAKFALFAMEWPHLPYQTARYLNSLRGKFVTW
jgi:hypothetical protein